MALVVEAVVVALVDVANRQSPLNQVILIINKKRIEIMKNSKYFLLAALGLMAVPALAQETYQDTKFAENSLTGTARYVGMGGAMEALGADISTISSNPAGIGLFRKGQVSLTAGVVAQGDADNHLAFDETPISFDAKKSVPSFDQIGVVWSACRGSGSYINLGFNYHKSTNFSQILTAANFLYGASQTKQASAKTARAKELDAQYGENAGDMIWNAVDANYNRLMAQDEDGGQMAYDGRSFLFGQYQKGYIGVYDFNISGAINNRVWLGLTVGIHDVHYNSNSYYTENFERTSEYPEEAYSEGWEQLRITGTGFDVKAGVIFRPVEDSPFRIGAYVNSPVFYDLSLSGAHDLTLTDKNQVDENGNYATGSNGNVTNLDYRLNTPWKVGVSLGHTVGSQLALGATYEYAWYDHMDNREKNGGYYDYYDSYYESSSSDRAMNEHTRNTLNGVSTLKLGAEYKPISMLAFRLGYNYVSSMFKENGSRDQSIASQGTIYSTSTDYTNWKSINRITAGVGFNYQKLFIDVAYQYSQQDGDFYPFMSNKNLTASLENVSPATKVKNNRHQLLMTVGYKF